MISNGIEPKPSILIVEDDQTISTLLHHLLVRRGYDVQVASDGQVALEMVDNMISLPQLIMLDVVLPYIDGFELINRIRSKHEWSEVPVIMLTSKAQERNIVRALEAGANDYMVKPFQPQELIARIRRFVK